MEMCDCLIDLIEQHNRELEHMYELAELLLETYSGIEDTDVNDVFCDVMNGMTEQSVRLCAIANCVSDVEWYIDDEGFVFTEGTNSEECECDCECPKISDYLN